MTASELIARIRAQARLPSRYRLGGGKLSPVGTDPLDELGGCDCSAFVMWNVGIPKYAGLSWLKNVTGGWYSADGIYWDATRESTGFFREQSYPQPGAIVVYPAAWLLKRHAPKLLGPYPPRYGHVGIVTTVAPKNGRYQVMHCSSGNYHIKGHAIAETDAGVFARPATVFAWAETVTHDKAQLPRARRRDPRGGRRLHGTRARHRTAKDRVRANA
jgi:hypothetical protein